MGAQPIPPVLVKRWKAYFPQMQYDTTYGLSEGGGPGVVHLGMENEHKVGAIGRPSLVWDLRIVDDNGKDVPAGEVGEFIVKSSGIMKGYYKNPDATARAIRDGWLYTGDLGRIDEDGFIHIVDRKKDLVISGGVNVYPRDIEEVAVRHPDILDAAVFGAPDERWGESPIAAVRLRPETAVGPDELRDWINERVQARYQRVREVVVRDEFPLSVAGKTLRRVIRDQYLEQR